MPPIVLQKILGHADIQITNKYYIDVDRSFIDSENKNFVNYMKEHNLFNEYYLKAKTQDRTGEKLIGFKRL